MTVGKIYLNGVKLPHLKLFLFLIQPLLGILDKIHIMRTLVRSMRGKN